MGCQLPTCSNTWNVTYSTMTKYCSCRYRLNRNEVYLSLKALSSVGMTNIQLGTTLNSIMSFKILHEESFLFSLSFYSAANHCFVTISISPLIFASPSPYFSTRPCPSLSIHLYLSPHPSFISQPLTCLLLSFRSLLPLSSCLLLCTQPLVSTLPV